ncbi:2-amino-4-hydroxy-6-hydroxymethyldihydropteridine pyrophosphokinase [Salisediminibacterium beveridgei]|uniref:2-amino-4-hydroxy-6-hydroxymethyldihydropteridine diphosphokinase n=2 Tax=Salisediminibacterium beveridgei TaxID=632773 RepID=A0A1D7R011_9BACI|nr:2-amino-4-hydroxy-6-hydroxymethyldihydropteridine pyrophosphokinase [Salisediminibacterium beveridgei]
MACALTALEDHPDVTVLGTSAVYETVPVGVEDQPSFLNMVVACRSEVTPEQLLTITQAIESSGGRERLERWGPRTIDLDILRYGHHTMKTERLQIPHPRMMERAFVLIPLLDVAALDPDLDIEEIQLAIEACDDCGGVIKYANELPR